MLKRDRFDPIDVASPGRGLTRALEAAERRFGVTLTIHDHHALLYDADGKPFWPGRDRHIHPYCGAGRYEDVGSNRRCLADCGQRAEATAHRELRPFWHHCWKGVAELVVPVIRHNAPVLILYAGAFRGRRRPPARLRAEQAALPVADPAVMADLASLLDLLGQGMLRVLETRHAREQNSPPSRKRLIRRFLDEHAHEPVSLADLASALHVSPSRASHLVTGAFAVSFQELLMNERMTRARNLLQSTAYPLKEVARGSGFGDPHYFSRIFRRYHGVPPGQYRRKHMR